MSPAAGDTRKTTMYVRTSSMYVRPSCVYTRGDMRSPLGSRAVDHVVQVMALNPGRPYFLRELARLAGEPVNGARQAIRRLVADGIVAQLDLGDRPAYSMDPSSLYFEEIQRLGLKSLDIPGLLDAAEVTALMVLVYGSFAKGDADTSSDLDVLVVGAEPTPGAAEAALGEVGGRIGRQISVRVVPHAEYARAADARSGFVGSVLAGPVIALRGQP